MKQLAENVIPFLSAKDRPLTILAVEDDRLERAFLGEQIRQMGHMMEEAADGQQALEILRRAKGGIDVVLMDRLMPVMDGLSAVRLIKDDPALRKIPVIMVTGASTVKQMQEGLEAGVFYYLAKPVNEDVLRSVLLAATREAQQNRTLSDELKRHHTSFNLIRTCKFNFRTLNEAECLAAFTAHCFPDPERVLLGLAELLTNAVEHGNLEIGYERKSQLLDNGTWLAEIERRQQLDSYGSRTAELIITRKEDGFYAIITDQGNGFNWKRYMTIEPARAGDNHGRGIAQANAVSFDKLTYNQQGNQAIAFVGGSPQLEW
ncbi:MAG: response regulator [Alphaproteobacteria bacterium]|jgi:two-component system cell cycle response regulator|nr:response regulator [Alphaproteobacteria bacterium]